MAKILFIDGTKGFSPYRLKERPTGGIITSLTLIPQYLANKGHNVSVLSTWEQEKIIENVRYFYNQSINDDTDYDDVVFNRNCINNGLVNVFENTNKIWWLHDIVDYRYLEDDAFRKVDKIIALSQYCVDSYSDFYDIPLYKFTIIENGVDKNIFHKKDKMRNPNLYIMASAPVKGLYPIDFTLYNLKRFNPDIELRMYVSQKLHDFEDSSNDRGTLKTLKENGAVICDPIKQEELAEVMREAWCLLMPNHYPEICSNLLLQAQACGLPVISVPIGSVPEYIQHGVNGLLTQTMPHDMYWWWKDFAKQSIKIQDKELQEDLSWNSIIPDSWEDIGEKWEKIL